VTRFLILVGLLVSACSVQAVDPLFGETINLLGVDSSRLGEYEAAEWARTDPQGFIDERSDTSSAGRPWPSPASHQNLERPLENLDAFGLELEELAIDEDVSGAVEVELDHSGPRR